MVNHEHDNNLDDEQHEHLDDDDDIDRLRGFRLSLRDCQPDFVSDEHRFGIGAEMS